jgi:hypothetical protein
MMILEALLQTCGLNIGMCNKQVVKIVTFLTSTEDINLIVLATQAVREEETIIMNQKRYLKIGYTVIVYTLLCCGSFYACIEFGY